MPSRLAFALLIFLAFPAAAADTIRSLVDGASLTRLKWPNVSDYQRHLDAFYKARNDAPAWSRDGRATSQAEALATVFAAADRKGVNAVDYDGATWDARLRALTADAEAVARFDVDLTATLMRYISDLHIGRVNPRRVAFYLDIGQKKYDLPQVVSSLVDTPDIAKELERAEPQYDGYRRLRAALERYVTMASEGEIEPFASVKLKRGDTWPALPKLAAFLLRTGDLRAPFPGDVYKEEMVDAVKRFQSRHGLAMDGAIGAGTIAAMNVPLSVRVDQLKLAMERWRWVPTEFAAPPIVVNIPEFRLRAYDEEQNVAVAMNVVVGKTVHKTPIFAETLEFLIFRPYWNVPPSIQRNELMPKVRADPGYLRKNNYEMVDGRIRQKPGPGNALGNVKFMLPNPMNIYLHDTPSRAAFERSRRDFSHGCIRLGNPGALAEWVLRDQQQWSRPAIDEAMANGPMDRRVNLTKPIPVLIVYATAAAREDGQVYFFADIYGHDETLADALDGGYPYPR